MNLEQWVNDNLLHQIISGSRLYGTAREEGRKSLGRMSRWWRLKVNDVKS